MNLLELLRTLGLISDETAETLAVVYDADGDLTELDSVAMQDAVEALHVIADAVLDLDASAQTDDHVTVLDGIAETLVGIAAEQDSRDAAVAERTAQIAERAAQIRGDDSDEDDEADADAEPVVIEDSGSDDEDDEGGEPDAPVDAADDGDGDNAEQVDDLEPVLASVAPIVSRVAARRPTRHMPPDRTPAAMSDDIATWGLTAAANVPGQPAGARITNEGELAQAFLEAWRSSEGYTGASQRTRLFSMGSLEGTYDQERILDRDATANSGKIAAAQRARVNTRRGLVASGGNPAPEENRYDIPVIGSEARPVRDQFLTRFGATRGGINTITPPRLAAVDDATSVHTNTNDVASATKSFATVTAGAEATQLVDAIVKRIRFGEFQDRFLPELIAAWVKLCAVSHARLAEETLIAEIATAGTNVSAGDDLLSATRDILSQLDRLAIAVRSRERLGHDFPLDVLLPDWAYGLMRVDISRQTPGSGTITDETLAVADATIDRLLTTRNINPVWSPDMQVFGEQGVGAIQGFPDTVVGHVCASGAHLFLDGGSLDLGIVRDSSLNDTNDVEMFSETFEQHHFHHQVPAYQITMDVDPSGTTSAAAAFDPSATGS